MKPLRSTRAVSLIKTRRRIAAPTALITLLCFAATLLPPHIAKADPTDALAPISDGTGGPRVLGTPPAANSPQALANVDLATGSARVSYVFELPTARGQAQPSLSASYDSSRNAGPLGMGWNLDLPSIVRKGSSAQPIYDSIASDIEVGVPIGDDYYIDGQLLVPVCQLGTNSSGAPSCAKGAMQPGEVAPTFASGWTYFRREIDDGARYFLSPDGTTFVCQTKAGNVLQFGHPLDGMFSDGLEFAAPFSTFVYRWNLVRNIDASNNAVSYVWDTLQSILPQNASNPGAQYLTDIYDTPPAINPAGPFAHHTHLSWALADPSGPITPYSPVWRSTPFAQLTTVDITSATFQSTQRQLLKRYTLNYVQNSTQTRTFLQSVTEYGCPTSAALAEGTDGTIAATSLNGLCPSLPPTTYGYSQGTVGTVPNPPLNPRFLDPEVPTVGFTVQAEDWSVGTPYIFADVAGDGVARYVDATGFADGSDPQYDPRITPATDDPQLIYGDWLGDAKVDWLWLNLQPATPPDSGQTAMPEIYTPSLGAVTCRYAPCSTYRVTFTKTPASPFPATNFAQGRALDVDGDGLTDMALVPISSGAPGSATFFTTRTKDNITHPFSVGGGQVASNLHDMDPNSWGSDSFRTMADMNGDGLPDLVIVSRDGGSQTFSFHIMVGLGDGEFGSGTSSLYAETPQGLILPDCVFDGSSQTNVCFSDSLSNNTIVRMSDFTGDGFADLSILGQNGLLLCARTGQTFATARWACTAQSLLTDDGGGYATPAGVDISHSTMTVADVTGSGIQDPILFYQNVNPNGGATPVLPGTVYSVVSDGRTGTRPGLLTQVVSSTGAQTTIAYDWAKHYLDSQGAGQKLSVPTWIVTDITTTNGLTSQQVKLHTSYSYDGPVYDARDQLFAGFQHVTETADGDVGSPGSVRKTTFATDACNAGGQACSGSVDYSYYHALRGLPVFVEESDKSTGAMLRTTWSEYKQTASYPQGLDGRRVLLQWGWRQHVFLWDGESPNPVNVDVIANASGPTLPLSEPNGGTQLQREVDLDSFGNESSVIDFGRISGNNSDQVVAVSRIWYLPPGDTTGWTYRVKDTTYSEGLSLGCNPLLSCPSADRTFHATYYATGLLKTVTADLSGSKTLPGPSGAVRAAGQPSEASSDGTITVAQYSYDPAGNLTRIQQDATGNRCTDITYDLLFWQLPTSTSVYQGGCPNGTGVAPLTTIRAFDRGLGRLTMLIAPSGGESIMKYDGFGRITELDEPDPENPNAASQVASLMADYQDSGPVRRVHFSTIHSVPFHIGFEPGVYADHYRYLDSFGDTLVSLDRAGTDADGLKYTVSGAHFRYQGTGLAEILYQPSFFTGDASTFPADTYPYQGFPVCLSVPGGVTCTGGTPTESFQYDALGRVLVSADFNGHKTNFAYHPSTLSTDVQDAEQDSKQTPNGPHNGSLATLAVDGHGRKIQTTLHLANGPRTGDLQTFYAYQPTGEPTSITQTFPGGGSYTRSMTYDTLGRMTVNSEPNSGGWTYAYNNYGQVVGTADARGCGENVFHDQFGRVVAEDYSPCDGSVPTMPNLATGYGTEAFNKYDPATGRLSQSSDRAQTTTYGYDFRDRVTSVARQIATPTGDPDLLKRYASHVYTKTIGYNDANRIGDETTGADAPELSNVGDLGFSYTYEGAIYSAFTTGFQGLLSSQAVDPMGAITQQVFADAASTTADMSYYPNGKLQTYHLHRPSVQWAQSNASYQPPAQSVPNTLEAELTNLTVLYDKVNNPTSSADAVVSWPQGIAAATQTMNYFDDYRLAGVQTAYAPTSAGSGGTDSFSWPPYAPEQAQGDDTYPAAIAQTAPTTRVSQQNFSYDWLGNTTSTTDDQHAFLDRSLGTITNGNVASGPPHQMRGAASSDGQHALVVGYDPAGHVTSWIVYSGSAPADISPGAVAALPQWTAGLNYPKGQQVSYQGKPYQCMLKNCLGSPLWPPGADGDWSLWQGVPLSGINPWDPQSVSYHVGDLVTYQGTTYECVGQNLSNSSWTPDTTPTLWQTVGSTTSGDQNSPVLQVYQYTWDEMGRLASASRQDAGDSNTVAETFAYDAAGSRVRTSRQDSTMTPDQAQHTVDVFGSLMLSGSLFEAGDYDHKAENEHVYLSLGSTFAHAFYKDDSEPTESNGKVHIFYALGDPQGSTSFVIDHDTGEVVERATYMAYGAAESDFRTERWDNFHEQVRYTAHRDNAEVGLVYFGARYLAPQLGRWISPDPLTIHGLAGDINPYALAQGSPTRYVDPIGLQGKEQPQPTDNGTNDGDQVLLGGSNVNLWNNPLALFQCPFGCGGSTAPSKPPVPSMAPNNGGANPYAIQLTPVGGSASLANAMMMNSALPGADTRLALAAMTAVVVVAAVGVVIFAPEIIPFIADSAGPALYNLAVQGATVLTDLSLAEQGIVVGGGGAVAATGAKLLAETVEEGGRGIIGIGGGGGGGGGGGAGQTFFRVITQLEPEENFVSNAARGLPPRGPEVKNPLIYNGISVFDSLGGAAAKVPVIQRGGNTVYGIGQLWVPPGADIGVAKTLGSGHYTLTGSPGQLQGFWVFSLIKW